MSSEDTKKVSAENTAEPAPMSRARKAKAASPTKKAKAAAPAKKAKAASPAVETAAAPAEGAEPAKKPRRRRKPKASAAPPTVEKASVDTSDPEKTAPARSESSGGASASPAPEAPLSGSDGSSAAEVSEPRPRRGRRRRGQAKDSSAAAEAWVASSAGARVDLELPKALIDEDAIRVVRRLQQAGHIAVCVGGCVRDLAHGSAPKDFDVATSARPEQVKRLFRNARVIGRRFRLVHVRYGRDRLIEVATFRGKPQLSEEGDDLLVASDNVYGTPQEDAARRDFTINGLFYDPGTGAVIDFVGGADDLKNRLVRCIGDASVRVQEDPVRIIRALRFAAKLHFELEPSLEKAIRTHGAEIGRCASARVWEEWLKVLRSGSAHRAVPMAASLGFLEHVMPQYAEVYAAQPERCLALLEGLDKVAHEHNHGPSDVVSVGAMVLPALPSNNPGAAMTTLLDGWVDRYRVPRRLRERLYEAVLGLRLMMPGGPWVDRSALTSRGLFEDAQRLLELLVFSRGEGKSLQRLWSHHQAPDSEA